MEDRKWWWMKKVKWRGNERHCQTRGAGTGVIVGERQKDRYSCMYLVRKAGCVGIGSSGAGETGGNRQFERDNAVEPGDKKTRAKAKDGERKKDSPGKMFFYISSLPAREFS